MWQRYSPKILEFNNLEVAATSTSKISPVRIIIPGLNIDDSIYGAQINNKNWQSTTNGISYLSSSPIPGEKGNSNLYGHNWKSILGNLVKIKPGDKIKIVMNNGETREFEVEFTSVVDSSQTYILSQTKDNRITLYTCTGFLDRKRFVATATLIN
ncbi:MAG: sortase [Ignavibacteria bacterium]|nr:sortase [Ignavibacteria bacterium]